MSIDKITREHVLAAVDKIERENITLQPSTKFDVVINGKAYPPKEIMRYANLMANKTMDWPNSGGEPTNKYLEKFGFEIQPKEQDNAGNTTNRLTNTVIKLGCNWGKGAPSFYKMIRERKIAICADDLLYQPNDLILVTQGQTVFALARILKYPQPVTSNLALAADFNKYKIDYEEWVKYASAEWYELSKEERFSYNLQQGRCYVHLPEIKNRAIAIWNNRFTNKSIKTMNIHIGLCINTILYGPPGTGKTYNLNRYKEDFFTDKGITKSSDEVLRENVNAYPFWQILAAVMSTLNKPVSVSELLSNPVVKAKLNPEARAPRSTIWRILQSYADSNSTELNAKYKGSFELFQKDKDSRWGIMPNKNEVLADISQELMDIVVHPEQQPTQNVADKLRYHFITFHQKYSYEDFIEGIKPMLKNEEVEELSGDLQFELKKGIFYNSCLEALKLAGYESFEACHNDTPDNRIEKFEKARNNPAKQFALFIDEINRANISAVFGELITLLEEDKRTGVTNEDGKLTEMWIKLPYSHEMFSVPSNLYVIGTMNTADRSIALLDIALRRRFEFKALYPEYHEGAWWSSVLQTLNDAIYEKKRNADFFIGHAFFINKEESDKTNIFNNKIIPLLNEYFQNNAESVKHILNKSGIGIQQPGIKNNYQIVAE
ncbi:McrB family protein [Chitinophaga sp. 22536]|uniref:McrB family protein n=1 Tax=unclassified Chitinophaga TaxID=2619133 RepID=UPI003F8481C4